MGYTSFEKPKTDQKMLFECSSPHQFPASNYYLNKHGKFGSVTTVENLNKDTDYVKILVDMGMECIWHNSTINLKALTPLRSVYEKGDLLITLEQPSSLLDLNSITIRHSVDKDLIELINLFNEHVIELVTEGKVFLIIKDSYGGLDLMSFDVKVDNDLDLELHYGSDFNHKIEVLIEHLNGPVIKGLSLLHGDVGTGKSTALKLLTKKLKNKKVIFVPPFMVDSLSDPSFLPFLIEHKGCILIIEDAEKALLSRDSGEGSSSQVSTILNMSDGILADALDIHTICTFNSRRENIDKALLREGRLIIEHKFESLSLAQSNKLLSHIYKEENLITNSPLTLAQAYSFKKEKLVSVSKEQTIGFHGR